MHVNKPETLPLSVSKDEVSDKDTSLEISDDESFSQPLDVSEVMKKRNIEITGTELVKIFSSQLSDLHNEIFQLKHKIDELEKEKTKNKFTPNEKEKLKMFKAENETLRLENFELSETVNKLEKKLNLTTENMTRLVEKYKENDYDINKLEHLSTLQLKNKIKKQDQIIKSQEEDFCKVLETRDTFKTTLDRVNEENKKLSFKIKELTKNDINKKILNFAIEENEKLQSELILERERVIKFQTDNKNGEKFYNKKKDENANLRLEIGELQSIITSMSCSFENKNTQKVTLENNEWESCSEASVEITSEKKITQNPKSKEKIINQDQTTNFLNSKTFFPSKNQKSKSQHDKVDQKKICYFYTQKRCKFGEKCFNLHPKNYLFNNFQNTQKINRPPLQSSERTQYNFQKNMKSAYQPFYQNSQYNRPSQIIENPSLNNPSWSAYPILSPDNFPTEETNSYQKYYSVPIQNSFDLLENNEQYEHVNYSAPISKYNSRQIEKY